MKLAAPRGQLVQAVHLGAPPHLIMADPPELVLVRALHRDGRARGGDVRFRRLSRLGQA